MQVSSDVRPISYKKNYIPIHIKFVKQEKHSVTNRVDSWVEMWS